MTAKKNADIVRHWIEEIWEQGNLGIIDNLVAANYVSHAGWKDRDGLRGEMQAICTAFTERRVIIGDVIAEGDKVVVHCTLLGTHRGSFEGIEPTRRQIAIKMVSIHHLACGKIVEGWYAYASDRSGLKSQFRGVLGNKAWQEKQVGALKVWAGVVLVFLLVCLCTSLGISWWQLSMLSQSSEQPAATPNMIWLCVAVGALGSSVSAIMSALDRVSNGWELSDGTKLPQPSPPDKFVGKMVAWYMVRPFLGSIMGFVVYVGIVGGYLIAVRVMDASEFSPQGLAFLCFLGGLMAKTLLGKLKQVFKDLFGA